MQISFNPGAGIISKYIASDNTGTAPYKKPDDEEEKGIIPQMFELLPHMTVSNDKKQISSLQKALNTLDYTGEDNNPLKIDGIFGKNSRHALKSFQSDLNLPVTGEPDENTFTKLRSFFNYRGTDIFDTSPQNDLEYYNGLPTIKTKSRRDFNKAFKTQNLLKTGTTQASLEKTAMKSPVADVNDRALNVMEPIQAYAASTDTQKSVTEEKTAASAQENQATDGRHLAKNYGGSNSAYEADVPQETPSSRSKQQQSSYKSTPVSEINDSAFSMTESGKFSPATRSRLHRNAQKESSEQATDGRHLLNNIGGEKSIYNVISELKTSLDRLGQEQNHYLYEMDQAVRKGDLSAYDAVESKYFKIKENYELKQKQLLKTEEYLRKNSANGIMSENGNKDSGNEKNYLEKSFDQVLLGNYTDDVTLLGTAGQVALGLAGVDLPADIRDITYDLTNWKWSWGHAGQTLTDIAALIPVVGALKYTDEAGALIKNAVKYSDETADLLQESKYLDEAIDAADAVKLTKGTGETAAKYAEDAAKGAGKLSKVYSANGDATLRAIRRPSFDIMMKDGVEVNGIKFKMNEHTYNSLFKSGRKDIKLVKLISEYHKSQYFAGVCGFIFEKKELEVFPRGEKPSCTTVKKANAGAGGLRHNVRTELFAEPNQSEPEDLSN